jgi:uncharacterized protein YacL
VIEPETQPDTEETFSIPVFVLRAFFFLSAVGLGAYVAADLPEYQYASMIVSGLIAILVITVDALAISRSSVGTTSAIVFGLLIGFLAAQLFIGIISLMGDFADETGKQQLNAIRLALTLIFCYLGPTYILRTKDDFRFIVPYVEFQRLAKGPSPLILDTSAIIDGRIVDLARANVFDAPFIVPRFVVEELQRVADLSSRSRRERGRRGLDRLRLLQQSPGVEVQLILARYTDEDVEVDRRLIEVSRARGGKLVTTDFNLQKVCEVEGIPVINLNEIAQAVHLQFVPGDMLQVKIVRHGEGAQQGVGYLSDGTMTVVEGARGKKGTEVTAQVTSQIQSSQGRMVFARVVEDPSGDELTPHSPQQDAAPRVAQPDAATGSDTDSESASA